MVLFIATFVTIWGLITHGTYAGAGDEPHYLMIARSLAFDGDVDLANDYADRSNLIGGGTLEPGAHVRPGPDGTLRPVHDVGLPLLAAPVVALAYQLAEYVANVVPVSWLERFRLNASLVFRHQISLLMALVTGLVTIELARWLAMTGATARHAFWWALLGVLSPPLLSHSFLFFTEIPSALLVLVTLRRILARGGTSASMLVTGLLIGLLCLVHIRNAPIALALVAIGAVQQRAIGWHGLGAMASGVGLMLVARTIIHARFWGTPFFDEHVRVGDTGPLMVAVSDAFQRLTGMLFDQEIGLLAYAPIYLLAPAGLIVLWRRLPRIGRPVCVLCAVYVAALITPMVNRHGWNPGFSPAARYLVPIAPLLLIGASMCARNVVGVTRVFVLVVIAVQVALDAIVWQMPKLLWNNGDGVSTLATSLPSWMGAAWTMLPTWHTTEARAWPFWAASALVVALAVWLIRAQPLIAPAHHER